MSLPFAVAPHLTRDPAGYWTAAPANGVSYPDEGNEHCYQIEDGSFWFRHRNAVVVEAVKRFPPAGAVFDVGGGNGFVCQALEQAGFAGVVVEPGPRGAANACKRGLRHVVCATLEGAGFAPGSLPAVGLFDVVEHIEHDGPFLRMVAGLLAPGGRVYITVPAFPWLWAHDDVYAGHFRRYTRRTLRRVLTASGFVVEFATYFFAPLPPPIFAARVIPSWFGVRSDPSRDTSRREHTADGGRAGRVLDRLLTWERHRIAAGRTVPVGSSLLAVARLKG